MLAGAVLGQMMKGGRPMRKLKRSVARHNMIKSGWRNLNRKHADGQSTFAKYWRDFVVVK